MNLCSLDWNSVILYTPFVHQKLLYLTYSIFSTPISDTLCFSKLNWGVMKKGCHLQAGVIILIINNDFYGFYRNSDFGIA